jgi:alkylhydroperoxidase family enzyme
VYTARQQLCLEYADAISYSEQDVSDELFSRICGEFELPEIVELTMTIAWENASAKFNHAFLVESMGTWKDG